MKANKINAARGRPPKFREERRPITVTLPTRILETLRKVDPDRARAIVKVTNAADPALTGRQPVEIIGVAPGSSLIVVVKNRALESVNGVRLVEIAPARYLITVQKNLSLESLEVQLQDKFEGTTNREDRDFLADLLFQLRRHRRLESIAREDILIIST